MRTTLEQASNIFIKNRDTLKNVFKWEHDQIVSASSLSFLNFPSERGVAIAIFRRQSKPMRPES
jgi:hypothetical protein